MTIDSATPATQNGHDKSIRYRPSHDTNLQQAQNIFLLKYVHVCVHVYVYVYVYVYACVIWCDVLYCKSNVT